MTTPKLTLSIEDAADQLNIGRSLAYKMARDGRLPVIHLGRRIVVPVSKLEDMLNGR